MAVAWLRLKSGTPLWSAYRGLSVRFKVVACARLQDLGTFEDQWLVSNIVILSQVPVWYDEEHLQRASGSMVF